MLQIKAPAKINWSLSVFGKREDGYHNIISLIHAIDLYDTLIFENSSNIELICDFPIKIENNLVYKAVKAIQDYTGFKRGIKITLRKEIPIGAGLGGGSSDAAATLIALNEIWELNLSKEKLMQLGSSLGSDIAFFFKAPLCIVEGKGEKLQPLKIKIPFCLMIVKPSFSISTKWAYEALGVKGQLTENYEKINNNIWQLYDFLCKGTTESLYLWNDLEKAVIKRYPEIDRLKKRLINAGAVASLMSGSGSTVFGVFQSREEALSAIDRFKGYWTRVVQTLTSLD